MDGEQGTRKINIYVTLLGVGVAAIVTMLVILWWDVVRQPYLQENFSYNASTVSTEAIYDTSGKVVTDNRYLINNFQLNYTNIQSPQIKATYDSSYTNNKPYQHTEKDFDVSPVSGRYIRDGKSGAHILGPQGIRAGASFSFMHPKYPIAAEMGYKGTQTVGGVTVYQYQSTYPSTRIDAPSKGVALGPNEKLTYDPSIQLWIEPLSGWLVKYQDDSSIYRYNTKTGERGALYSHLTERTSDTSVTQNAAYALSLRQRMTFAYETAPSLLFAIFLSIGVAVLIGNMRRRIIPLYGSLAVIGVISVAVLAGWTIAAIPLIAPFGEAGMNPLTAICFLLIALAIATLRVGKRPYVALLGGIVAIFALLQIFGELQALPFSIDLLFFRKAVLTISETVPSRMSLYIAFTLLVLSICLLKAGFTSQKSEVHFAKFMAGVVVTLGVFGLLLRTLQIDQLFSVPFVKSVSFVTALLFVISGFALLQQFRNLHGKKSDIRSIITSLRYPALATIPLIIIGTFAQIQQTAITTKLETNFKERITSFESTLSNKTDLVSNTLRGTAAFIGASKDITRDEFKQYSGTFFDNNNDKSLQSIGFAKKIDNSRATVTFVEPQNSVVYKNGYNLLSNNEQKIAATRSATTNSTVLSPLLPSSNEQKAVVSLVTAVTNKSGQTTGYVFGVVDVNELIAKLALGLSGDIEFEIYDGIDTDTAPLIYDSNVEPHTTLPRIAEKSTLFIGHHPWTVIYAAEPSFQLSPQEEYSPTIVLLGGTLAYFGILTILYFLVDLERRARLAKKITRIRRKKQKEV